MEPPDPPQTSPSQRLTSALLLIAALAVLSWGALPYLPSQIDDAFIVFAYAHRIVEHGEIAWNTGVRVEGYSSPLHLFLMVVGCLAGFDLSVYARLVSFVAAIATLLVLGRRGVSGAWLALFVAAWQPFQHWAVAGLETALATLLGAIFWPLIFGSRRAWALGCIGLTAFSLTRPEGVAWLAAGVLIRARQARAFAGPERAVAGAIALLGAYHVARIAYFGAVFPTPWLVKIVATRRFERGASEALCELLSAVPLFVLVVTRRASVTGWVWLPLALQTALLVRAGGDWMGNARFILPGMVASAAAALGTGEPRPSRARLAVGAWIPAALLPLAAASFLWEPAQMQSRGPRWRDPWFLERPLAAPAAPWAPPLLDEVKFLVERIPVGAGVEISDVGLPGNLDDIRIWDGAGLTDRVVAQIIAAEKPVMSDALRDRYLDPTAIWCVRYGLGDHGEDPGDDFMKSILPNVATPPDDRSLFWRCRDGGEPTGDVVTGRWQRLLARFPVQDGIRWEYARALIAAGRTDDALTVARAATWVGDDADGWLAFGGASHAYVPGRGWPLYANGGLSASAFPQSFWETHQLSLDADDPGPEGARAEVRWEPHCGATITEVVSSRTSVELPDCDSAAPRGLAVAFINDEARPGFDRNLYVTLDHRPSPISAGP